jgi:hypothetical protein
MSDKQAMHKIGRASDCSPAPVLLQQGHNVGYRPYDRCYGIYDVGNVNLNPYCGWDFQRKALIDG